MIVNDTKHTLLSHDEVKTLMTSYIQGQLSSDMQRSMQLHISRCHSCFEEQQAAEQLVNILTDSPAAISHLLSGQRLENNLGKLFDRLEDKNKPAQAVDDSRSATVASQSNILKAAVVVLSVGMLFWVANDTPPVDYRTLSSATEYSVESDRQLFRLVFKPDIEENQIRQLLRSVDGQLVAGPSEMGVYTIAIPNSLVQQPGTLNRLKKNPLLLLAEKTVYQN